MHKMAFDGHIFIMQKYVGLEILRHRAGIC